MTLNYNDIFILKILYYYFMYTCALPACMSCTNYICAWYMQRPEESIRSPRTGVTDICETPCWHLESNLGLTEE